MDHTKLDGSSQTYPEMHSKSKSEQTRSIAQLMDVATVSMSTVEDRDSLNNTVVK